MYLFIFKMDSWVLEHMYIDCEELRSPTGSHLIGLSFIRNFRILNINPFRSWNKKDKLHPQLPLHILDLISNIQKLSDCGERITLNPFVISQFIKRMTVY